MPTAPTVSVFQVLPISQINPSPHQARKDFDPESLKSLAASMKQEGLIQPITVRLISKGLYELISGERRLRAAGLLGWEYIETKVIGTVSEGEAAAKGLVENLQREDLNPIEEADGFVGLQKVDPVYWTQAKIAEVTGRDQTYISRSMSLLQLPGEIQDNMRRRIISRSHALELLRLRTPSQQLEVAKRIPAHLTVAETRTAVNRLLKGTILAPKADTTALSDPLEEFWPQILLTPEVAPNGTWDVSFGIQKIQGLFERPGWSFRFAPPALRQADLADWFEKMAKAIRHSPRVLAGNPKEPMEPKDRLGPPLTSAGDDEGKLALDTFMKRFSPENNELERWIKEQQNIRLPQNPTEESGLEAAARQSPQALLAWIYGPKSLNAQKSRGLTWKDAGVQDPAIICRTLVQVLREYRSQQAL